MRPIQTISGTVVRIDGGEGHDLGRQCPYFLGQGLAARGAHHHPVALAYVRGLAIDDDPVAFAVQGGHGITGDAQAQQAVAGAGEFGLLPAVADGQAGVIEEAVLTGLGHAQHGDGRGPFHGVPGESREFAEGQAGGREDPCQAFGRRPAGARRLARPEPFGRVETGRVQPGAPGEGRDADPLMPGEAVDRLPELGMGQGHDVRRGRRGRIAFNIGINA